MKHFFTLIILLGSIGLTFGQGNRPVLTKVSATWCPNCGSWGWNMMDKMVSEIGAENATIMAIHHSGELNNAVNASFSENLNINSQPSFYFNNTRINVNGASIDQAIDEMKTMIDEMNSSQPEMEVKVHGYYGENEGDVIADVTVDVNQTMTGEFTLGVYLLGDDYVHFQSGQGNDAEHKKLLLGTFTNDHFGDNISDAGEVAVGTYELSFTNTFTLRETPYDIAVIVWRKDGDTYMIQNSSMVENIATLSSNENLEWIDSSNVYFDGNNVNVEINALNNIGTYKLSVLDVNGKLVYQDTDRTESQLSQAINAASWSSGMYIINVQSEIGAISEKLMINK